MNRRIIAIDDEQAFLDSVKRGLAGAGYKNIRLESNPREAALAFKQGEVFDVAIIDITMPEMNGVELLEFIRNTSPNTECIMITAMDDVKLTVQCIKKGAYDYLLKPLSRDALVLAVNHALERKHLIEVLDTRHTVNTPSLLHTDAFKPIITRSEKMFRLLKEAELHATTSVPILISGESGTGKELLARAIHDVSPRAKLPFTPVNMAALSPNLFDAEFFGHTKGAFTGAESDRKGYLESTHQGTLFLDEIGHLVPELQGKLLRVLQEGEFFKLGTSRTLRMDIRFIAATNVDLNVLMEKKIFRNDLYYRLRGAWLRLPSLRERKEDIPLLIQKFLHDFVESPKAWEIDPEVASLLTAYDYPGNIRELRSLIQAAVNLSPNRRLSERAFPEYIRKLKGSPVKEIQKREDTLLSLADVEKSHVLKIYEYTGQNKVQSAKILDIGLNTLRRKLRQYGVR